MAALSSYTPISTQTLSSGSTEITFNSFTGYTDLVLVCNVFGTANYSGFIRFNGDTGSNYSSTTLQGNGSTATSGRATSDTKIYIMTKNIGFDPSYLTTGIINIQNYSNATTYKTVLSRSGVVRASVGETTAFVGTWRNTAAITSFTIISDGGTYASGSTFSLYGIANTAAGAKATGGFITSDSSYFYHSFYATDTFTPTQSLTCDYLVVAGGGGGGKETGAGGGAGGFKTSIGGSPLSVTATGYTITVGAGGTGATTTANGVNGGNSTFSSITSTGGGGGASYNGGGIAGSSGGSGGGGGYVSGVGGAASPAGQGNAGGAGAADSSAANFAAGGGGGAGAVGGTGVTNVGGVGGVGLTSTLNAQSLATYYAGGGGGSSGTSGTGGLGGLGGGGAANKRNSGSSVAGTTNTGGGGGGNGTAADSGSAGGSGVVIIRYAR